MKMYALTEQDVVSLERLATEIENAILSVEAASGRRVTVMRDIAAELRDVVTSAYDTPIDMSSTLDGNDGDALVTAFKSLGCDPSNAATSAAALRGVTGCSGSETPFAAAQRSKADLDIMGRGLHCIANRRPCMRCESVEKARQFLRAVEANREGK